MTERIATLAARLRGAYQAGPIAPIRGELGPGNLADAYAVQRANTKHWVAEGRRIVGRKIGLTARAVQAQFGVDQPDFGALFADMEVDESEPVAAARVLQPRIEAEIAFVLERDLAQEDPSLADIVRAIGFALPALEIVGSRIAGWDIGLVDTVADNASAGLFVLGGAPRLLTGLDLHGAAMTLCSGDAVVSSGRAEACLGNPLIAVRWLARTLARHGDALRAGDIVLSGALGPMVPVRPGDRFQAAIEGLGRVSTEFAA